MKNFTLFVLMVFCWITATSQNLNEIDKQEIRKKASILIEDYEYLLNYLSNSVYKPNVKTNRIQGSYGNGNGFRKIFKDSLVIIEDDLNPKNDPGFQKDVTIYKYLNDFSFRYSRSNDRGVNFDSILVSDVQEKEFIFTNVFFICDFLNSDNANPDLRYLPTYRKATVQADYNKEFDRWDVFIVGVSFSTMQEVKKNYEKNGIVNQYVLVPDNKPKVLKLDAVASSGLGSILLVGGLIKSGNAKNSDAYKIYQSNTDPDDGVWQNLGYESREAVYENQNKKYKSGTLISVAGGAALITAGILIIKRMKNSDSPNKGFAWNKIDTINPANFSTSLPSPQYQFGFTYRF